MKNWISVHTAIQGRGHIRKNTPCQDKTFSLMKNGTSVIALSDGAGAYEFSEIGAEVIVTTICEDLAINFNTYYNDRLPNVTAIILEKAQNALQKKSIALNIKYQNLAGTLLFVAVNNGRIFAGHIGDGIIGALSEGEIKVLSKPENTEYVNVTYFVTSKNALSHFRCYREDLNNFDGFILLSDGSTAGLFDFKKQLFAKACIKFFNWLDDYSIVEVKDALIQNITTFLLPKTLDDCSIGLLKAVSSNKTMPASSLVFNALGLDFAQSLKKQYCDNAKCTFHNKINNGNIKTYHKRKYQVYCNNCYNRWTITKGSYFSNIRKKEFSQTVKIFYDIAKGLDRDLILQKYQIKNTKLKKLCLKANDFIEELKNILADSYELSSSELNNLELVCKIKQNNR